MQLNHEGIWDGSVALGLRRNGHENHKNGVCRCTPACAYRRAEDSRRSHSLWCFLWRCGSTGLMRCRELRGRRQIARFAGAEIGQKVPGKNLNFAANLTE
jgi:hypothetical protein